MGLQESCPHHNQRHRLLIVSAPYLYLDHILSCGLSQLAWDVEMRPGCSVDLPLPASYGVLVYILEVNMNV